MSDDFDIGADDGDGDAVLQKASWFGDRLRGQLKQHPEVDRNIRGTLNGVVGSGFTPEEIGNLENRALDAANPVDVLTLQGLQSGNPVTLTPNQWTTVDDLLGRMSQDELGQRAYNAFKSGLASGKIKVVKGR